MHELVPSIATVSFLENPNNPIFELTTRDVLAAATVIGLDVQILKAGTDREIDAAFVSMAQARTGALLVGGDLFFNSRIDSSLHSRRAMRFRPCTRTPEFVVAGGLNSYGTSLIENYRLVGLYTGRILKGEKLVNLPVQQSTKIELIINLKTARALGLHRAADAARHRQRGDRMRTTPSSSRSLAARQPHGRWRAHATAGDAGGRVPQRRIT